jgi:hypothetical protein
MTQQQLGRRRLLRLTPAASGRSLEIMVCMPEAVTWQVKAVHVNRGTGPRPWFAVYAGDRVVYLAGAAEVQAYLAANGLAGLVPLDDGLPAGEDGCG